MQSSDMELKSSDVALVEYDVENRWHVSKSTRAATRFQVVQTKVPIDLGILQAVRS